MVPEAGSKGVSPAGALQLALAGLRSASYTQPPLQEASYMVQLYQGAKGMFLQQNQSSASALFLASGVYDVTPSGSVGKGRKSQLQSGHASGSGKLPWSAVCCGGYYGLQVHFAHSMSSYHGTVSRPVC